MSYIPKGWNAITPTKSTNWRTLGEPLYRGMGWSFYEDPVHGDEAPLLALSLDFIGEDGPVIFRTTEYEVPEFL